MAATRGRGVWTTPAPWRGMHRPWAWRVRVLDRPAPAAADLRTDGLAAAGRCLPPPFALLTPTEHLHSQGEQSSESLHRFPALLSGGEHVLSESEQSKLAEYTTFAGHGQGGDLNHSMTFKPVG